MRWPWQSEDEPAQEKTRAPSPAAAPAVSPMGWAFLPPLQRTVGDLSPITRPTEFQHGLPAWRNPTFSGSLTHLMSPGAPSGVIDGDGSGTGSPTVRSATPDLTLLPPHPPQAAIQRKVAAVPQFGPPSTPGTSPSSGGGLTYASSDGLPLVQAAAVDEPPPADPGEIPDDESGHEHAEVDEASTDPAPAGTPDGASDQPLFSQDTAAGSVGTTGSSAESPLVVQRQKADTPLVQRTASRSATGRPRLGLGAPLPSAPPTAVQRSTAAVQRSTAELSEPLESPSATAASASDTETSSTQDLTAPPPARGTDRPLVGRGESADGATAPQAPQSLQRSAVEPATLRSPTPDLPLNTPFVGALSEPHSGPMDQLQPTGTEPESPSPDTAAPTPVESADDGHMEQAVDAPDASNQDAPGLPEPDRPGARLEPPTPPAAARLPLSPTLSTTPTSSPTASPATSPATTSAPDASGTQARTDGSSPIVARAATADVVPGAGTTDRPVLGHRGSATGPTLFRQPDPSAANPPAVQHAGSPTAPGMPLTSVQRSIVATDDSPPSADLQTDVDVSPEHPEPPVAASMPLPVTSVSEAVEQAVMPTAPASPDGGLPTAADPGPRSGPPDAGPAAWLSTGTGTLAAGTIQTSLQRSSMLTGATTPAAGVPRIGSPSTLAVQRALGVQPAPGVQRTIAGDPGNGGSQLPRRQTVAVPGVGHPETVVQRLGWRSLRPRALRQPPRVGEHRTAALATPPAALPDDTVTDSLPESVPEGLADAVPESAPASLPSQLPLALPPTGSMTDQAATVPPQQLTSPFNLAQPHQVATEVPIGTADAGPSAAATGVGAATGTPGADGAQTPEQLEALAQRLFTPLMRRLKAEMLLDRERRGLRTDTW